MDLNLADKVFIVTGGAKGIGKAIVLQIAKEGGIPVVLDNDSAAGESLNNELEILGHRAFFIKTDLCDLSQCESVVKQTIKDCDSIHGLINNAGVNDMVSLENGNPNSFRDSIGKNLNHYYDMAYFCLPHLRKSSGVILNMASKTAMTGQGGTSGYAAAKGGILALTREWAVELLKDDIRVNAIVPAEVMTPLYKCWLDTFDNPEEKEKAITDRIPLGKRMTTSEEIANTALFLLSDKASHITGQHIHVDGGYTHLDRII